MMVFLPDTCIHYKLTYEPLVQLVKTYFFVLSVDNFRNLAIMLCNNLDIDIPHTLYIVFWNLQSVLKLQTMTFTPCQQIFNVMHNIY